MKKVISLILALVMCLSLCACGGGDNSSPSAAHAMAQPDTKVTETTKAREKYTIDDLLGVWHSEEAGQILFINPEGTKQYIFESTGSSVSGDKPEIDGNVVTYSRLGKFELEEFDDSLKLICTETGNIGKGVEFVKVENIIEKEDLNGDWLSLTTGNTLQITEDVIHPNHNEKSNYYQWHIAGNTLYISAMGVFKIEVLDDTIKLIGKGEEYVKSNS